MPYLALDENFADNPKVAGLSNRAFRLHVTALLYCSKHLTDGILDARTPILRSLSGRPLVACEELVQARLWHTTEQGDYLIHDYLEWNASAAQVKEKRAKDRLRKRRASITDSTRNPDGKTAGLQEDSTGSAPREELLRSSSLSRELAKTARARKKIPVPEPGAGPCPECGVGGGHHTADCPTITDTTNADTDW